MRPAWLFPAAATILLSACASAPPDQTTNARPGLGVVADVREARVALPPPRQSNAVEELTRRKWIQGHQLTLRMDDGTVQQVTQDNPDFKPGDRVQVTNNGRVVTVAAAAPAAAASPVVLPSAPRFKPGIGVVETTVHAVPSASAGASAPASQEIRLRMGDGSLQVFDHAGPPFNLGDRVEVTPDGRLLRR